MQQKRRWSLSEIAAFKNYTHLTSGREIRPPSFHPHYSLSNNNNEVKIYNEIYSVRKFDRLKRIREKVFFFLMEQKIDVDQSVPSYHVLIKFDPRFCRAEHLNFGNLRYLEKIIEEKESSNW